MNLLKIAICVIMAIAVLESGCSEDETTMNPAMPTVIDCTDISVSYTNDILPIVNASCAITGCHLDGFTEGDFSTYAGLKEKADNGRITSLVVVGRSMPPSDSPGPTLLSPNQIRAFKCWIDDGAPEN